MPARGTQRRRPAASIRVDRRKAPRGLASDMFSTGLHTRTNPIEPTHHIGVSLTAPIALRANVQGALARQARGGRHQVTGDLVIGLPKGMEKARRVLLANERADERVEGELTPAERTRKLRSHRERDAVRGLIASSASVPVEAVGDRFYYHNGRFYTYANFVVAPSAARKEARPADAAAEEQVGRGGGLDLRVAQVPLLLIRSPRAIAILRDAMARRRK